MTYSEYLNSDKLYTFPGILDGNSRTLTVHVIDEYDATTDVDFVLDNVNKSSNPTIEITSISSYTYPCEGSSTCFNQENGGNLKVNYTLKVADDVTPVKKLLVCVSENADDCVEGKTENFVKYEKMSNTYVFDNYSDEYAYPPSEEASRNLYASVIDSDCLYGFTEVPIEYNVYHNFPPVVSGEFSATTSSKNDDGEWFSASENAKYSLTIDGNEEFSWDENYNEEFSWDENYNEDINKKTL